MKGRWGREADGGGMGGGDSACALPGPKRPRDAERTKAGSLFVVVCCSQVREKLPRTTHILTPKISQDVWRAGSMDNELAV